MGGWARERVGRWVREKDRAHRLKRVQARVGTLQSGQDGNNGVRKSTSLILSPSTHSVHFYLLYYCNIVIVGHFNKINYV